MFRKKEEPAPKQTSSSPQGRVTSILGADSNWKGSLTGRGGVRIEGLFEGKIDLEGMVVVDPKGRLESDLIRADTVIVSGAVRSDIQAQRVEIRSTGKVWGNVTTVRFSTEEGAYLRGKIQMEDSVDDPDPDADQESVSETDQETEASEE